MSTSHDIPGLGRLQGGAHAFIVSGMPAAGYAASADDIQNGAIQRPAGFAGQFTNVRIETD
jgi:hypothetical protein